MGKPVFVLQKIELSAPEATSTLIRWPTSNLFDIQVIGISLSYYLAGQQQLGLDKGLAELGSYYAVAHAYRVAGLVKIGILTTQSVSLALDAA